MTTSETLDLKPCPFCGVHLFHNGATELGDIYEHPNNGCAIQVAWFTATDEWVEKWNRRPSITDSQVEAALPELPIPACTFADHSYRAFTERQMRDYARAALEAALSSSSPVPVGEWQPIDDETPFAEQMLVWEPMYGWLLCVRSKFVTSGWEIKSSGNFYHELPASVVPVMWHKLPAPPAAQEQANGIE